MVARVGAARMTAATVVLGAIPVPVTAWPTPMAPAAGAETGRKRLPEASVAVAV